MPGMNGLDLLRKARELSPDTVRVMLTGQADLNTAIAAVNQNSIFRFLTKPCSAEELAHTLDVTPTGVRLGAVHRQLNLLDEITVFYRQHKRQYRVVWTKKLKGTSEFQVGLQAVAQETDAMPSSPEYKVQAVSAPTVTGASGVA
jgi:YesN/AraC family two-component response regulator